MEYYIIFNGQQVGPMPKEQLLNYGLNPDSNVWAQGMPGWMPAYTVPELMELIKRNRPSTPPPFNQNYGRGFNNNYNNQRYNAEFSATDKSKVAAGVLALLLGGFGAQYFYCGKIARGFISILLTIITFGIWNILTFIQGIMMLCMTQREFENKYVLSSSTLPLF